MRRITRMPASALACALAGSLMVSACENDKTITVVDETAIARVEITSANLAMLEVDSTIQLQARAYNAAGAVVNATIVWSTDNSMVATISNTGLLRTLDDGMVNVTATAADKSARFQLLVEHKAASLALAAAPPAMHVAEQYKLQIRVLDPHGKQLQRAALFVSLNPDILNVDQTGNLTALKEGTATIAVTSEGVTSNFQVTVMPSVAVVEVDAGPTLVRVGETAQYRAHVRDGAGHELGDRTISWASSNTSIATVDGNGLLTAVAPGTVNITATSEQVTATFSVVVAGRVATVNMWPSILTVFIGNVAPAQATALDANGTDVPNTGILWSTSDKRVATVDQNGVVTAVGYGVADIIATVDGVTARSQVVVPPIVNRIVLTPCFLYLTIGEGERISAKLYDGFGSVVNTLIGWQSGDPNIATVDQSGLVTGVSRGITKIHVHMNGKSTELLVAVRAPVARIILPKVLYAFAGWSFPLVPILLDAEGNIVIGPDVHYSVSDSWVASVSEHGWVTARHAGRAYITVESEGVTATIEVRVYGSVKD